MNISCSITDITITIMNIYLLYSKTCVNRINLEDFLTAVNSKDIIPSIYPSKLK